MSRSPTFAVVRRAGACLVLWAAVVTLGAAPPEWLLKCADMPTPAYAAGAPAVVLLDQRVAAIDARGRSVLNRRYAVRILTTSGDRHAAASIPYIEGTDSVRGLGAWLVRGRKEIKPRSPRPWGDIAFDSDTAYSEYRARTMSLRDLAHVGDVFGFEARVEGAMIFLDTSYIWWSSLPVVTRSVALTVPAGWSLAARMDGEHALEQDRSADGLTWTWRLRDLPYRPDEPFAPRENWFDARVMVNISRPEPVPAGAPRSFGSWKEVADWTLHLARGQCDRDAALAAEVARLTSGLDDPLARIRAVSRHVQQLRYVSVNEDIGIGFGYRPRKATEVNIRGWGDCKDKANLMCAMLGELGIQAYSVAAHVGHGRLVSPEWPSPRQFNHAIVAIPVDASVNLPAVVHTTRHGPVLFFDATDPDTVLGDLPRSLQGTRVHIISEGSDELTLLPVLPIEDNLHIERVVRLTLAADGSVSGSGTFSGRGQAAAGLRGMVRRRSTKELEELITAVLGTPLRGAVLAELRVTDDTVADRCQIDFAFVVPSFCQFLPGDLAVVKLDLFTRAGVLAFPNARRTLPIALDGAHFREVVEITLPASFGVEELPKSVSFSEDFATYENRLEVREGTLVFDRRLLVREQILPVSEYGRLRRFGGEVAKADRASAILRIQRP